MTLFKSPALRWLKPASCTTSTRIARSAASGASHPPRCVGQPHQSDQRAQESYRRCSRASASPTTWLALLSQLVRIEHLTSTLAPASSTPSPCPRCHPSPHAFDFSSPRPSNRRRTVRIIPHHPANRRFRRTRRRHRRLRPTAHQLVPPRPVRSEAAFATLPGVAPLEASSGQRTRHRLSRAGDRDLNRALHTVAITRLRCHDKSHSYETKRAAQARLI